MGCAPALVKLAQSGGETLWIVFARGQRPRFGTEVFAGGEMVLEFVGVSLVQRDPALKDGVTGGAEALPELVFVFLARGNRGPPFALQRLGLFDGGVQVGRFSQCPHLFDQMVFMGLIGFALGVQAPVELSERLVEAALQRLAMTTFGGSDDGPGLAGLALGPQDLFSVHAIPIDLT